MPASTSKTTTEETKPAVKQTEGAIKDSSVTIEFLDMKEILNHNKQNVSTEEDRTATGSTLTRSRDTKTQVRRKQL